MPSKPIFTKRKGGFQAADFRVKITLDFGTYAALCSLAKERGVKPSDLMSRLASESFYENLHDEIEDNNTGEGAGDE